MEALIVYMKKHYKYAAHTFMGSCGKEQRAQQGDSLAHDINQIGPAVKDSEGWWKVCAFPKIFRKFPRNLPFEKIIFLSKISLFSNFFFWILIQNINSNLYDMIESTYIMNFHLENFPKFSEGGNFFFWKFQK